MSNALSVSDAPALPANAGGGFANPLSQMRSILGQPAIKRSLPLIFMIGLLGAAALAWMTLSTPPQRVLFASLPESDKAAVAEALTAASIPNAIDGAGSLTVGEDDYHKARMLLAGQGLPKAAPGGYALLDQLPMGVSRAVEGERLRQARETELARSIGEIDTVAEARVHLATPEATVFVRDKAEPSASVIVKLQPGRTLSDAQVRSIVNLVASSVPGMKAEAVTIVDQAGAKEGTRGVVDQGNLPGDDLVVLVRPQRLREEPGGVVGRTAGGHPVELTADALDYGERLESARGIAGEIRVSRARGIERLIQGLRYTSGQRHRPAFEVVDPFEVAQKSQALGGRHAARAVQVPHRGPHADPDRRGRAGQLDRQALQHRRHVVRLDLGRGARNPRHRDEPARRPVQQR